MIIHWVFEDMADSDQCGLCKFVKCPPAKSDCPACQCKTFFDLLVIRLIMLWRSYECCSEE